MPPGKSTRFRDLGIRVRRRSCRPVACPIRENVSGNNTGSCPVWWKEGYQIRGGGGGDRVWGTPGKIYKIPSSERVRISGQPFAGLDD